MKAKLFPVLLLAFSTLSIGQTAPPSENKPGPDQFSINEKYNGELYTFQVNPSYQYSEAYAGNKLDLKITITKGIGNKPNLQGDDNLQITDCVAEEKSSGIEIKRGRSETQVTNGFVVTTTEFSVAIDARAEPRRQRIKLSLQYPGEKIFDVFFVLRVYEKSDVKQSIVKKVDETGMPKFYTGEEGVYPITLRNAFSDYNLKVTRISVESVPADLIDFTENALVNGPVTIGPREEKRVELKFKVRGMSFTNLISGFGESTKLQLTVIYVDEYERVTTESPSPLPIKIRPPDRVLVIAMLAGVLIGGLIRFYLEFLARRRRIMRRELLKFVFYTVVFGLVVTAFALLGEVQIIVFKASGSYDRPIAIFLIGLAGAVGGLQLFSGWYNSLKPKGGIDELVPEGEEKKPGKRAKDE